MIDVKKAIRNNLFSFATSELAQDAFICWCLNWFNAPSKPALQEMAKKIIAKLTNIDLSTFDFSSVTTSSNMFGNVPINSLIYVKDDVSKKFILVVRSDLSNVQVKSA